MTYGLITFSFKVSLDLFIAYLIFMHFLSPVEISRETFYFLWVFKNFVLHEGHKVLQSVLDYHFLWMDALCSLTY